MSIFKRETITISDIDYDRLRNLLVHFAKKESLVNIGAYNYTVEAKVNSFTGNVRFRITFPKSWIPVMSLDATLDTIMNGVLD